MKARKRFGQHFLIDEGVLDAILRAVRPSMSDRLLEIGPGPGALTQRLYATFAEAHSGTADGRFVAVEIDRDLVPAAQQLGSRVVTDPACTSCDGDDARRP